MGDATNTFTFPGLDACVGFIRSGNSGIHEDGYFWLEDRAHEYVPELLALAATERHDFVRVTWIELLGASKDPRVVPMLERMLAHPHANARLYAVLALEEVGTEEALALAGEYRRTHPVEL